MFSNYPTEKTIFAHKICWWAVLLFISAHIACTTRVNEEQHAYFEPFFRELDSAQNEQSFYRLDSAFAAFPSAGIIDKAQKYIHKAIIYRREAANSPKMLLCTDSLQTLLEPYKNDAAILPLYARSFFLSGDAYFGLQNYEKAFENFVKGKNLLVNSGKADWHIYEYTERLATLNYRQSKYAEAATYYKQACAEIWAAWKGNFEQFSEIQGNLDNAAICYNSIGQYDSAIKYYDSAEAFVNSHEHLFPGNSDYAQLAKGVIYANKGVTLSNLKKLRLAQEYLTESSFITESRDTLFTFSTLSGLADAYIKDDKFKQADSVLKQIQHLAILYPLSPETLTYYKTCENYFTSIKDTGQAFITQQKLTVLKDSIDRRKKQFRELNIKNEFESSEQKALTELLKKDNQIKTVYLWVSVVVVSLFIVILILVMQHLKRTAKHVTQLTALNTTIKQRNDDLQKAFLSLEQSHKENSRIIKIVAHDLRNPVSAINNLTYSLLKKNVPDTMRESLEFIREACADSMALIKEVLNEEKKSQRIALELTDMKKLLEYCIEMLQPKAREKKQRLKLEAESVMVRLNTQKMWRVISNIINNAIKFSPEQSDIKIKLERKEAAVLLTVKDSGIGIPAEIQHDLFTLPHEGRDGTSGEESYGLGLSISSQIIEEHHGKIWFESSPGKGSVFYIELPC